MPRTLSDYDRAQLQSNYISLAILFAMQVASTTEFMWSGVGDIVWAGQVWHGLGSLASISTISEDSTLTATGMTVSLSGIPANLIHEALTEVVQGYPAQVYLAFLNQSTGEIVDVITAFAGKTDQVDIQEGVDTCTVSIAIENRLADLQRGQGRRATDQDQRMTYPNDAGFSFVNWMLDYNSGWGTGK